MKQLLTLLLTIMLVPSIWAAELSRADFGTVSEVLDKKDFVSVGHEDPLPTPPKPSPLPPEIIAGIKVSPTTYFIPYAQPTYQLGTQWQTQPPMPVFRGRLFPVQSYYGRGGGVCSSGG